MSNLVQTNSKEEQNKCVILYQLNKQTNKNALLSFI